VPVADELLPIGEVARRAGLAASAIRYYEDVGVLPRPQRAGGKRRYPPETVERLRLVRFCGDVGFSLEEIRAYLADSGGASVKARWQRFVDVKTAELDEQLARVTAARRLLQVTRDCDCLDPEECRLVLDGVA